MNVSKIVLFAAFSFFSSNCQSMDEAPKGKPLVLRLTPQELGRLAPDPLTVRFFSAEMPWQTVPANGYSLDAPLNLTTKGTNFWNSKLELTTPSHLMLAPRSEKKCPVPDLGDGDGFVAWRTSILEDADKEAFSITQYRILDPDCVSSFLAVLFRSGLISADNRRDIPLFLAQYLSITNPAEALHSIKRDGDDIVPFCWVADDVVKKVYPLKNGYPDFSQIETQLPGKGDFYHRRLRGNVLLGRNDCIALDPGGTYSICISKFPFLTTLTLEVDNDTDQLSKFKAFPYLSSLTLYPKTGDLTPNSLGILAEYPNLRKLVFHKVYHHNLITGTSASCLFDAIRTLETISCYDKGINNTEHTLTRPPSSPLATAKSPPPIYVEPSQRPHAWTLFNDVITTDNVDISDNKNKLDISALSIDGETVTLRLPWSQPTQHLAYMTVLGQGVEKLLTWVTCVRISPMSESLKCQLSEHFPSFKGVNLETSTVSASMFNVTLQRGQLYSDPIK